MMGIGVSPMPGMIQGLVRIPESKADPCFEWPGSSSAIAAIETVSKRKAQAIRNVFMIKGSRNNCGINALGSKFLTYARPCPQRKMGNYDASKPYCGVANLAFRITDVKNANITFISFSGSNQLEVPAVELHHARWRSHFRDKGRGSRHP